jgi:hypothetical protein
MKRIQNNSKEFVRDSLLQLYVRHIHGKAYVYVLGKYMNVVIVDEKLEPQELKMLEEVFEEMYLIDLQTYTSKTALHDDITKVYALLENRNCNKGRLRIHRHDGGIL